MSWLDSGQRSRTAFTPVPALGAPLAADTEWGPLLLGLGLIIALTGLIVSWLRNRSLRREVASQIDELRGELAQRLEAEQALKQSAARVASIFRAAPIGIGLVIDRVLKEVNESLCEMLACEPEYLLEKSARLVYPSDEEFERVGRDKYDQIRERGTGTVETQWVRKDGVVIEVLLSSTALDPADLGAGVTFAALDITDRVRAESESVRLEEQVRHAQKLESLGVLAGGIAHDFNNLLTAILGNADLARARLTDSSPAWGNLAAIEETSRRAAELCGQMLAYSGKGKFVIEPIDLSALVRDMAHILAVSVSKNAVLRYDFAEDLYATQADPSQVRQIVLNLITNASEAVEERSGVIAVTTGAVTLEREELADLYLSEELEPGRYVYLDVRDTGIGMKQETLSRLFDPFFSTKFQGRGLGLSAVLGIVRGHGGAIRVESEPGRGSRFRVYLPATDEKPVAAPEDVTEDWRGSGTILVADDEETIRTVADQMLTLLGFEVLLAEDGRVALEAFRENQDDIVGVILDLTMPHMGGEKCLHEIRALGCDVPVILSSGYSEQEVTQRFVGKGLSGFIQKPYTLSGLATALRDLLEPIA